MTILWFEVEGSMGMLRCDKALGLQFYVGDALFQEVRLVLCNVAKHNFIFQFNSMWTTLL